MMRTLVLYVVFVSASLVLWSGCLSRRPTVPTGIPPAAPVIMTR